MNEPVGTHTSRTIMLWELQGLLASAPAEATYAEYLSAAVGSNAVRKATLSTRKKTLRHLRELYALSPTVNVFKALRLLWHSGSAGRPLLAALCALARDPVLRATTETVLSSERGEEVRPEQLAASVASAFPGHYGPDVLARTARNLASSWQQSGLLRGRARKIRQRPCVTPVNTAYALYLGHLCGGRGEALFATLWTRVLDTPGSELRSLAVEASRQGWLLYREAGGVIEVRFDFLEGTGQK